MVFTVLENKDLNILRRGALNPCNVILSTDTIHIYVNFARLVNQNLNLFAV